MKKVFCKILEVLIIAIIIMQFNVIVYANEITDLQNEQAENQEKIENVKNQKKK